MDDQNMFHYITHETNVAKIKRLFEPGLNIDSRNERMETPLMFCLIHVHNSVKRATIVRSLLSVDADINIGNDRGQTALMYACILNQPDTINLLLTDASLKCDIQDFEGNTALMYACALRMDNCVKLLVDAHNQKIININPNITNDSGTNALDYALETDNEAIIHCVKAITSEYPVAPTTNQSEVCNEDLQKSATSHTSIAKCHIKELAGAIEQAGAMDDTREIENELNLTDLKGDSELTDLKGWEISSASVTTANDCDTASSTGDGSLRKSTSVDSNTTYIMTINRDDTGTKTIRPTIDGTDVVGYGTPEDTAWWRRPRSGRISRIENRAQSESVALESAHVYRPSKSVTEICEQKQTSPSTSKVYGTDLYPTTSCLVCTSNKTFQSKVGQEPVGYQDTGKFTKLGPTERARLISRGVWSAYGVPLPPIPPSNEEGACRHESVATLRRYLGELPETKDSLYRVDPDMWCIVESIKRREEDSQTRNN